MFDFKPPQFLRSEKRASQKQLAAALRESATKVRHASSFGEVVDAVLDIPSEHIDQKLLQLAKAHPQADVGDLEKILTKQYIKRTAYASSAVGAGAALPGGGTGVALGLTAGELAVYAVQTTIYILGVSRLQGVRPADREQRRALVLSSLLGEEGAAIVSDQLGLSTLAWARTSLKNLSSPTLGQSANEIRFQEAISARCRPDRRTANSLRNWRRGGVSIRQGGSAAYCRGREGRLGIGARIICPGPDGRAGTGDRSNCRSCSFLPEKG